MSENDESTVSTVIRINYPLRTPCISQKPNVIVFFDWQPSKIICGVVSKFNGKRNSNDDSLNISTKAIKLHFEISFRNYFKF